MACKRLFSKVTLTIDHAAFDGGSSAKLNDFVNKSAYMRQVNVKMMPFSTASVKASSPSDFTGQGAYNDAMSNASRGTYVFYVPENMQGTVATITSPENKDYNHVPTSMRDYATYVEFTGTLNKAVEGFQGDVTYKFYLGANNKTDFNVERGKNYAVTLSFRQGSLFDPYWKVNASLTDSRLFALMADAACTTDISVPTSNTRNLHVRKSRPGAMYVYMNKSGVAGSTNALLGKSYSTSESFPVSSLSDCSWYSAMVVSSSADAAWLSDRGIAVGWDSSTAKLSFTVTNPSKFDSHVGDSRSLSLKLLPNGSTVSFNLVLSADMSVTVADGLSLNDNFYLGQKRTVSVSGFQGSNIKYAAIQKKCGSSSSSALNSNVQWKTVNTGSTTSGFPSCALDGNGNVIYNPSSSAYSGQSYSGSLDVYAWYPNRFQSSHSGWTSEDGKIAFFSDDWLNDSVEVPIRILEPRLELWAPTGTRAPDNSVMGSVSVGTEYAPVQLAIDGTSSSEIGCTFKNYSGSSSLAVSSFDNTLYQTLLVPSLSLSPKTSSLSWTSGCLSFVSDGSGSGFALAVTNTQIGSDKLETLAFDKYNTGTALGKIYIGGQSSLGLLTYGGNPATGLFSSSTGSCYIAVCRPAFLGKDATSASESQVYARDETVYVSMYFGSTLAKERVQKNANTSYNFPYFCYYVSRGSDPDRCRPTLQFDLEITNPVCNESNITIKHTNQTEQSFTAANGTIVKPVYTLTRKSANNYSYRWNPDDQTRWAGSEYVPGELMPPAGDQTFSLECTNIHDHRTFTAYTSTKTKICNNPGAGVELFVRNDDEVRIYVVSHRAADILSRMGDRMTHAGREFARKVVGYDYYSNDIKTFERFTQGDMGPETTDVPFAYYHTTYDSQINTLPGYLISGKIYTDNHNLVNNGTFLSGAYFSWGNNMLTRAIWSVRNSTTYRFIYLGTTTISTGLGYSFSGRPDYMEDGVVYLYNGSVGDGYDLTGNVGVGFSAYYKYTRAFLDLSSVGENF